VTRYRDAHDAAGEAWITLDKQRIVAMWNLRFHISTNEMAHRLCQERDCLDRRDAAQRAAYRAAGDDATKSLRDEGIFNSYDLPRAMFT
jgi:hypothetical protein